MKLRMAIGVFSLCHLASLLAKDDAPAFEDHGRFKLNPDRVYEIAKEVLQERKEISQERPAFFTQLFETLHTEYPFLKDNPWTINTYYGATGHLKVLHASASEYLIIYGSDIGVRGQTGRYGMDIRTIVIEGKHLTQWESQPYPLHIHLPGDRMFLPKGKQKIYELNGWILECGQGRLWTAFPNVIWFNDTRNTWTQIGFSLSSFFDPVRNFFYNMW